MNTQIINAELALALRKCLPFVRRHAIISGGDGSLTYAFAVRALADADARQREQEAVKNIVAAEQARVRIGHPSLSAEDRERLYPRTYKLHGSRIGGAEAFTQAARAVRPGEGYLPAAPPAKGCDCDVCTRSRLAGSVFRNFNKGSQA